MLWDSYFEIVNVTETTLILCTRPETFWLTKISLFPLSCYFCLPLICICWRFQMIYCICITVKDLLWCCSWFHQSFPFDLRSSCFRRFFSIYLLVLPNVNGRYISPFLLKSSPYSSYSLNPDPSYSKPHLLVHLIWNLLCLTLFYWVF